MTWISLFLLIAALITVYSEKRLFAVQRKQYSRMKRIFRRTSLLYNDYLVEETMDINRKIARLNCILLELGKEALRENGDWVQQHREKPLNAYMK
jgi:hypothetical protein